VGNFVFYNFNMNINFARWHLKVMVKKLKKVLIFVSFSKERFLNI